MATPEGKVKAKVVKALKELDAFYFFPATGGYGRAGIPDIVGCYRGIFFAIECKAAGKKPTALQLKALTEIDARQGVTFIVVGDEVWATWRGLWGALEDLPVFLKSRVAEELNG